MLGSRDHVSAIVFVAALDLHDVRAPLALMFRCE
jgi:hypothetical protein